MRKEEENRFCDYDNITISRAISIDKITSRLNTVFKYKGIKILPLLKNINNNKSYMVNNENHIANYNYLKPKYSIASIQHIELFNTTIYTAIVNDDSVKGGKRYVVIEPTLTAKDLKNLEFIKQVILDELIIDISKMRNLHEGKEYELNKLLLEVDKIVRRYDMKINRSLNKLKYYIVRDLLYLGKIEPLMHDHMIEEVNCDGPNIPVYIWHREYESLPTNIVFTEKELDSLVIKIAYLAGKHISLSLPILDASLTDGSRVNITFGKEITRKGSTFTIRRFRADPITIIDLIQFKTITSQLCAYLWYCVEKGMTMLIAGGTASGKTVLLNAIASLIPPNNKIVSIEDTAEINLPHENWIQSVSRQSFIGSSSNEITLFDLLRAALRQRPDIIIVGETRGREAYTLFQAMATGHGGLSTIHGDSVDAVISRLVSPPMDVPLQLITSSLDMIILQTRFKNKEGRSVRRVMQIAEINGINDDNSIEYVDSFVYDANIDEQIYTDKSVVLDKIAKRFGLDEKTISDNIRIRKYILDWLAMKGIRRFNEVNKYISEFYTNPRMLYERLRIS